MKSLLAIKDLRTEFTTYAGKVSALNNVTFSIDYGEAVGIVGESGSGKSVAMLSVMRLLADNGRVSGGEITFDGKNLREISEKEMQALRGNEIGMIFQDPMTSLNPVFTIGNQLMEAILIHNKISKSSAAKKQLMY